MSTFYPLKAGNSWTYQNNNGSTFTNKIEAEENGVYSMSNSTVAHLTQVKKDGNTFYTDSYEAGNMQPFLKDNAAEGDAWEIKYKANTIGSVFYVVVKSTGGTKDFGGKSYADVIEMEGVMCFIVNGRVFNAGTICKWYYAKDTEPILNTSALGDSMPLTGSSI